MHAWFVLFAISSLLIAGGARGVVFVDQNAPGPVHDGFWWDTAFLTIQEGIDAATPDGEVWVADGTYVENVVTGEGVRLYGGFEGASGPGGGEEWVGDRDPARNVVTIDGSRPADPDMLSCVTMARGSLVDGFTITNGRGTSVELQPDYWEYCGGGVFIKSHSGDAAPRLCNNLILNNWANNGAGIYCLCSSPLIANNTLVGNWGNTGAGICCHSGSPTIAANTIVANTASWHGGAIYSYYSSVIIANNTIVANSAAGDGGGVSCYYENSSMRRPSITDNVIADNCAEWDGGGVRCYLCWPIIDGNVIIGNHAGQSGGGLHGRRSREAPTITNNVIIGNTADEDGGGISCEHMPPAITNNAIVGNLAQHGGGIDCWDEASPAISNNIIVGNTAAQGGGGVYCDDSSFAALTHNDVWGNSPPEYDGCEAGDGDISVDPLFVDPGNGDYHLTAGSPCIDAGDNDAPGIPTDDFDAEPRIVDGDGDSVAVVDIGADEVVYIQTRSPANWFVPGWVWFSIPLVPRGSADASDLLGFDCTNRVYGWDDAGKNLRLYPDDFTGLVVGPSYVARLSVGESYRPVYEGLRPASPFVWTLPAAGWCWVGVPGTQEILGTDLRLRLAETERSAQEDRDAPDPWLNWNWIYWDPIARAAKIMEPFGSGDDDSLHPWWGYRVWVNAGAENVTIIFP